MNGIRDGCGLGAPLEPGRARVVGWRESRAACRLDPRGSALVIEAEDRNRGATPDPARVERALRRWLEAVGYRSYDPYDGLSGAWPASLVRRQRFLARAVTQIIKQSPVNLRPLAGIRPRVLVKSLSDVASAALWRHRLGSDPQALTAAHAFLATLRQEVTPGFSGACWALSTPYVTRYIDSKGGEPNLFWTLNAAVAFLEAYELERRPEDLAIARSTIDFILQDLGAVDEGEAGIWFRYFMGHDAVVYNVAALSGALMQRVARLTGETELHTQGTRALQFVVRHQNPDGSWYYARGPEGQWVDGFHTGYVLEALLQSVLAGNGAFEPALRRGIDYYVRTLFTADHLPRYAASGTFPIEVQNCAQAIQTLSRLAWYDPAQLARARAVTGAVTRALFRFTRTGDDEAGYFIMSRGRWLRNTLPAVRWGEAPMLLALTALLAAEKSLRPSWELGPPPV